MDGEGKISLSSALELEYRVFEHERDCGTAGMVSRTGALLEYEGLGRIASVLLRRLNNANDEEYVLLAKCASVGSSRDCAVCVPDGSIAGVHARIIRHKSRYWIVSKDLNTRLERDGTSRRLSTRTAYAIRTGDRILLGHRAFLDVREYAQRDVNEPDS
jgi:pSer/pThr/pTyr-binding forkhead associated (FHA) protein